MIDIERIRKATARIRVMHSRDDVLTIVGEECGELITEIARMKRGRSHEVAVALEAIDCIVVAVSLLDMLTEELGGRFVVERLASEKMTQIESYKREKENPHASCRDDAQGLRL